MRNLLFVLFAFGIIFIASADISNLSNKKVSDQLYELSFDTINLDKTEKVYAITPENYEKDNRLFPVVYLLHCC